MEFGNGRAILAQDQIDLRQKVRVSKTLAIEVCHPPPLTLSVAKNLYSRKLAALHSVTSVLPDKALSL